MAYDPKKIVRDNWTTPVNNPKPVANTYYPTYQGADGLVHKSPSPAPMPAWSPEPSRGQKRSK